jgi:hypothetical protein
MDPAEMEKQIEEHFPVLHQPKLPTMNKKVAFEACIPGWQPKSWFQRQGVTTLPPITIQEQADAIVECVKAGACAIHTHPRDPETGQTLLPLTPESTKRHTEVLTEVMDRAFAKVDFVTSHHTWGVAANGRSTDYIADTEQLLKIGKERGVGNRYVQTSMIMSMPTYDTILPVHTKESVQEGVAYYESHNVKPTFSMETFFMPTMKSWVFDTGIVKTKPYWIAIQEGKHMDDRIFADPWAQIEVITSIQLARDAFGDDAFIALHPAGRNWLVAATIGLMNGVELIRTGIEDIYWLWPHKDDIARKASDSTVLLATIAKALGRELYTAEELRQRVGIKLVD